MNKLIKVIYICIFSTIFFSHSISNATKRVITSAKKKQQQDNEKLTTKDEIASLKDKINKYEEDCECVKEYDQLKKKLELLQNGSTSKKRKAATQKTEQREKDDDTITPIDKDESTTLLDDDYTTQSQSIDGDDESWKYANNISSFITKTKFMYDGIGKYKNLNRNVFHSIIADNTASQTRHLKPTGTATSSECNTITNTINKLGKKYKIDKKERIKFIQDLEKYRKIYA